MTTQSLSESALQLAQQGFSVIPLKPRSKEPLIQWAKYQAIRASEEQVREWWTMQPDANIGVVTGQVSGLVVVDIDSQEGYQTLEMAEIDLSDFITPSARTGRGMHYYFQDPDNAIGSFRFHGGDVKSDGGYVVAPPSIHPNGPLYEWITSPVDIGLEYVPIKLLSLRSGSINLNSMAGTGISEEDRPGLEQVLSGCVLFKFAAENPNEMNERLWYASITNLIPLKNGRQKIHELSKGYNIDDTRSYSYEETEAKISHALKDAPGPHSCRYIQESGFQGCSTCEYLGRIKNPISISYEAGQGAYTGPYQVYTLADALSVHPPMVYVVDEIIPLPSLTIVYGAPGSRKSMLVADLAFAIAQGSGWLPGENSELSPGIKTTTAAVLWLDFDMGPIPCQKRFSAFARARGMTADAPYYYCSMSASLDAGNTESVRQLENLLRAYTPKVMVIDTLSAIRGSADENSSLMSGLMTNLRRVTEKFGLATIIIHHQTKGSNGFSTNAAEKLRGHSSIMAAADLALFIETNGTISMVTPTKCRHAEVEPFEAKFWFEHIEDTKELKTAGFTGVRTKATISKEDIFQGIMACLADRELNQTQLLEQLQGKFPAATKTWLKDQISMYKEDPRIRITKGANNATVFALVSD